MSITPRKRSDDDLGDVVGDVVAEIRRAQRELVGQSNLTMIQLFWRVGAIIVERQQSERYGSRLIDRLSGELSAVFAPQRSWSARNLRYKRAFALAWTDEEMLQARLQYLSWSHHQILLDRIDAPEVRRTYADVAQAQGWSTRQLVAQIANQHVERRGVAPTNFAVTLADVAPELTAGLATDPYRLDFLRLDEGASERAIEEAIVHRVTEFLTHLGRGFAYMGRQWRLTVGDSDFFLDLVFYNVRLHSFRVRAENRGVHRGPRWPACVLCNSD
jgi:predicted nuclease of restriction endonuclease-like (RecB) superfamily